MANEIASTIWAQITMGRSNAIKVMSWGANTLTAGKNEKNEDYLQFKVQGLKLKGIVRVVYDLAMDTYRIEFYKQRTTEPYKTMEMVYFDELNEKIDLEVEYTGDDKSYKDGLLNDELKTNGKLN